MTKDEAISEIVELEDTMPALPYTGTDETRAKETAARLVELYRYVFNNGAMPKDNWKPSVPMPTEKERLELILHWAHMRVLEST